ncbi:MAG: alpha/beta hydrolase [Clostridiales bacterium]|jgi:acetyl esterase/lipase|nr:alpha/beta hydrolase [Clostridiales bacterium]
MRHFTLKLNELYPAIGEYECTLTAYLPDNSPEIEPERRRPAFLVLPGGGYRFCSARESEPVALRLVGQGYAAFVLQYSTAGDSAAKFPTQLLQACHAVKHIKDNAPDFHVAPEKVFAIGFSAGGHLCASLGLSYDSERVRKAMPDYEKARVAAIVPCYPVVTGGEYAHRGTFDNLTPDSALLPELSLENAVTKAAPPAFIWHTADDGTVPVMNSILLAKAYAENNVPFELHIFEKGAHGLSLCDAATAPPGNPSLINPDAAEWFGLMLNFVKRAV